MESRLENVVMLRRAPRIYQSSLIWIEFYKSKIINDFYLKLTGGLINEFWAKVIDDFQYIKINSN